jgi:quinol monooxygenase YgiN
VIVIRFKIKCSPDKVEQAEAVLRDVIAPSRRLEGVISFDIARDISDADSFIATEVFTDREALDRQESLPEVKKVIEQLPDLLASEPEATIYFVSSSEPWGD